MDMVRHKRPFFAIAEVSMLGREMIEGLSDVCKKVLQNPTNIRRHELKKKPNKM